MATPIGHALAGFAVYGYYASKHNVPRSHLFVLCTVMALAPDLDLLPGLLVGNPILFHQGITHSFGFALLISLGAAGIYACWGKPFAVIFMVSFLSYVSHLLLDFLGPDGREPYGTPLFWPISAAYFISPLPILPGVHHYLSSTSGSTLEFFYGVLTVHNLVAMAVEMLFVGPFLFLGKWIRNRRAVAEKY